MTRLPVVSGKEVIKTLAKIGYYTRGQTGSYIHLRHPARPALTIPNHDEIARGTLRTIIKQAGLTIEEFNELLHT